MSSSADQSPPPPDLGVEQQELLLDELLPRPGSPRKRLALASALLAGLLAIGLLWVEGYLFPRPTASGSLDGTSRFAVDHDRGMIVARSHIPNRSNRSVRLTGVELGGEGIQQVDSLAALSPDPEPADEACSPEAEAEADSCSRSGIPVSPPSDASQLPIMVPAGRSVYVYIWLDPVSCRGLDELPWGHLRATFDFGPGSIPPFAETIILDDEVGPSDDQPAVLDEEPADASASSFLASACAALGYGQSP
jgi:hypothetical protein